MILKDRNIIIDITDRASDEAQATALELARQYDHYTAAIDSYYQMKEAERMNGKILNDLKGLGVTSVTWKDHRDMFSTEYYDKTINL